MPEAWPGQVPVGMVHEVDDRGGVGRGRHLDHQFAGGCEGVGRLRDETAGIALVAVGRDHLELDRRSAIGAPRRGLPELLVEPHDAAVEVVGAVVGGERVRSAVEGERAGGDAVGAAAAGRAEIRMSLQVAVERVEAEHHVDGMPAARPAGAR